MSESANDELEVKNEIKLGGNRELIDKLRKLNVETGSLACLGCKDKDGMCGVIGCAIMRDAAVALIDADMMIDKLATVIVAKEQRIRRLEHKGNEAIKSVTSALFSECSDFCVHAPTKDMEDDCGEVEYICGKSCQSFDKCVCKNCRDGSRFEWKELRNGGTI